MRTLFVLLFLALGLVATEAAPVTYEEVSLLVRMHEAEPSIIQTVSQRRLLRALTPEQEAALKRLGAEDSLVAALRRSDLIATAEDAAAFEAWKQQIVLEQRRAAAAAGAPSKGPKSLPPPPTGPKLVIDRIIMKRHPIPPPYFLYLQAKSGRSEATFFVPKKRYGSSGVEGLEIAIPVGLELADVSLDGTAEVSVQLDNDESAVTTFRAYKKHLARIGITRGAHSENFIPDSQNTPFEYQLDWHVQ